MNIITMMCPLFLKEKQACWNIEHTLSMFLHTRFLQKPITRSSARRPTIRKKIFKQNKRERNREKKERWLPLRTLCDAPRHSAIHPSSLCLSFYCWLICRKQYRSNWYVLWKLRKMGNWHLSYNIYCFLQLFRKKAPCSRHKMLFNSV